MPDYRRNWVPGGTYFFTAALLERNRDLLVAEIGLLREAVGRVKRLYPFEIIAWVVLPDHLHCVWSLPPGDVDYAPLAVDQAVFRQGSAKTGTSDGGQEAPQGERPMASALLGAHDME